MIATLYDYFLSRKYITPNSLESLLTKSARYITYWSDHQPSSTRNYFQQNPFLPLELIDNPTPAFALPVQYRGPRDHSIRQAETTYALEKKMCKNCKRWLTQASFSKTGWTIQKRRCCWVCRAVLDNLWHWQTRDRMRQKKDEARARRELGTFLTDELSFTDLYSSLPASRGRAVLSTCRWRSISGSVRSHIIFRRPA